MKKSVCNIAGLFCLYTLSCWPLVARYYYPLLIVWCTDMRVCMIINYVLAVTVVSIFFSMVAMVLKYYRIAWAIMIIPFFVQAVVVCSSLLVFLFHRELTAAMAVGRLRAAGDTIWFILKTPVDWVKQLFSR